MRRLMSVVAVATLGGCAVAPAPTRVAQDPYQWHVVSVTPVQRPPGSSNQVEYTNEPLPAAYAPATTGTTVLAPSAVYTPVPVYTPLPVYTPAPAYYYPPVSIGLDFVFGFGRHWGGGRGHYRRR
jgi:uncharacterized lipoprotein